MKNNYYLAYFFILIIIATLLNFTKSFFIYVYPYVIAAFYIYIKHIFFNEKIKREKIIDYTFFLALIFLAQSLFIHYYWNKLNNEFLNMFQIKENMQSVELYKAFLYKMDEIITHKILFLSSVMLFLIFIGYLYIKRAYLRKQELIHFIDSPIILFISVLFGIFSFFISIEAVILKETFTFYTLIYGLTLIYSKKSEKVKILKPVFETFYFSFLSLFILKIALNV